MVLHRLRAFRAAPARVLDRIVSARSADRPRKRVRDTEPRGPARRLRGARALLRGRFTLRTAGSGAYLEAAASRRPSGCASSLILPLVVGSPSPAPERGRDAPTWNAQRWATRAVEAPLQIDPTLARHRAPIPSCSLLPDRDVDRPEVSIVIPGAQRGADGRRVRRLVPGGSPACRGSWRDPDRRQLDRRHRGDRAAPTARGCCKSPKRGLGRAYIDALPFIRGRYVIMGDADCTYDFRELGRSSRSSARATSSSWARGSRARSSPARCRRSTGTSARRSRPGS